MTEITVEKVRELNAARTQGDWCLIEKSPKGNCYGSDRKWNIYSVKSRHPLAYVIGDPRPAKTNKANADLIAAAPAMAALIIKQSEQLTAANALVDRLEDYLKHFAEFQENLCVNTCLAEIQQFKGGK